MFLSCAKFPSLLAAALLVFGSITRPVAAADLVMHTPGIAGDSTTPGHTKDIALQSLSFGVVNPGSGTNDVQFSEVTVTKVLDVSSVRLGASCALGTNFNTVTIYQTRTNGTPKDLVTLTLHDAHVTGYSLSAADSAGRPTESVSLHFSSMSWQYATLP